MDAKILFIASSPNSDSKFFSSFFSVTFSATSCNSLSSALPFCFFLTLILCNISNPLFLIFHFGLNHFVLRVHLAGLLVDLVVIQAEHLRKVGGNALTQQQQAVIIRKLLIFDIVLFLLPSGIASSSINICSASISSINLVSVDVPW